jgi:hypothetical protein
VGRTCCARGRGKCTRFWWESPKERDHSEDRGVDRMDLGETGRAGAFSWLRIGTGGGLL